MATQIDAPEPDFDVAPTRLSDEQINKDRAAAAAKLPDQPMDAAKEDIISHPANGLTSMADKLEKAMKEVRNQSTTAPTETKATDAKTEPVAATPAEPAPEEKTITSAKAADWKAVKEKAKAAEARATETEQKLSLVAKEYEEFKKKAVDMATLEAERKRLSEVQAEYDKVRKTLETVALERSDEFKSSFDAKFTESLNRAKDAVGAKAEQIESLMQLPPSKWRKEQINTIREELSGVDQGQLDVALSEYDRTRIDRDNQLKNSEDGYKKLLGMKSERANREKELESHRIEAAINSVVSLAKERYDAFKQSDNEELNKMVPIHEERIRKFYKGQLAPNELALMPILAAEQERQSKFVIPALESKIKELEATLAEYDKTNPKPAGGATQQQPSGTGQPKSNFIDTFNKLWPAGSR